jgi:hypothetical protein
METDAVGLVVTEARIENLKDLWVVEQGLRSPEEARAITVPDALVDTGATLLTSSRSSGWPGSRRRGSGAASAWQRPRSSRRSG